MFYFVSFYFHFGLVLICINFILEKCSSAFYVWLVLSSLCNVYIYLCSLACRKPCPHHCQAHFIFPKACPLASSPVPLLRKPILALAKAPTKPSTLELLKCLLYFPYLGAFKYRDLLEKIFCLLA